MTFRTFRGTVPREGLVKTHPAHMPGEWARSRSRSRIRSRRRSRRQGLSERKS